MSIFELEDRADALEKAEGLICLFLDFADSECPDGQEGEDIYVSALAYAMRTQSRLCAIECAIDLIRSTKEALLQEVERK